MEIDPTMDRQPRPGLGERVAPYAEVVASLGVTLAATLALAVAVLVPLMFLLGLPPLTVEVPLVARSPAAETAAVPELLASLEREQVARDVEVVQGEAGERLVLSGIGSPVAAERAVLVALASGGFDTAFDFRPYRDPDVLVEDMRVIVPLLAVQATVFLLAGGLLIRMRVPRAAAARASYPWAAIVGAAGGFLAVGVGSAAGWLLEVVGLPVSEQEVLVRLLGDPSKLLSLAPWVVLAAPLAEEVFFRGYVFRFLQLRVGALAGVLVSSLLFAAVHLNLSGLAVYAVVGVLFALVYRRTSNLLAPIVAHATYNGLLLLSVAWFGI